MKLVYNDNAGKYSKPIPKRLLISLQTFSLGFTTSTTPGWAIVIFCITMELCI